MRKLSYFALNLMLLAMAIYLCSCASSGGGVDVKNDPIKPAAELKEGTVDPSSNSITITKEGISITVEHWSRARLDRKFTTASQRSPFFFLETWPQSMQSDVFHIMIKNDTAKGVLVNFKETKLYDERNYEYIVITHEELRYKFVSKSYMDLKTKNGLDQARQTLLTEVLGPNRLIPAGKMVEGYTPFFTPSSQAEKVWLIFVTEKEPESATANYQRVDFRFDYKQDLVLRKTQPPTKR
ncbi:MAG: hypothetical protein AAB116_01615 [Candidatus Poribacteria bacterium]